MTVQKNQNTLTTRLFLLLELFQRADFMITSKQVANKLKLLGYDIPDGESEILEILIDEVRDYILNYCNIKEVPAELNSCWVSLVCQKYLQNKLALGDMEGVENGNISSISEGETSISYDNSNSSVARMQKLIDKLGKVENQLIGFRKVKW